MAKIDDEGKMALWCVHNPDQAAAEIERLREALKGIDRLATRHVKGAMGMAQRIARAALSAVSNGQSGGAT